MRSLQILLETFPPTNGSASTTCPEARRIYPAHGPLIVDGYNKVREYIAHRSAREQQVLAALREIRKSPLLRYTGLSPFGIVRAIYPSLSWKLRIAAAWTVEKHLDKLEAEGVARRRDWLGLPLPPIMGIRIDRIFLRRWFPH
jgi:glyoxylase-like metal-dependent hydrolase (beta-lactamase superfamily II)